MKKIYLLFLVLLMQGTMANAQVIWADNFDTAALWSASSTTNPTIDWSIGTAAPTGQFSGPMGVINSTSGGNFALFDSDGLGVSGSLNDGYLELNSSVDCTPFSSVFLRFESYFRPWQTTLVYVEVSADNGISWTPYQLHTSVPISGWTANPESVIIDVSAAVGVQTKIRFHYVGAWDYAWMVDNVQLDAGVNDLMLSEASAIPNIGYTLIPVSQRDSIDFFGTVVNVGLSTQTDVVLDVNVVEGVTPVYAGSSVPVPSFPLGTQTLTSVPKFYPQNIATYTVQYVLTQNETDVNPADNTGSKSFDITTDVYARDDGTPDGTYQLDGISNGLHGIGVGYQIVNNDVVSGIQIGIPNVLANIGKDMDVWLMYYDGFQWDWTSFFGSHTIAAADLGTIITVTNGGNTPVSAGDSVLAVVYTYDVVDLTTSGSKAGNYVLEDVNFDYTFSIETVQAIPQIRLQFSSCASIGAVVTQAPAQCFNAQGSASAAVVNGAGPYTYLWSDGQTSATATGLSVGTISCTVTDANGCVASDSVAVQNQNFIDVSVSTIDANCSNSDGEASVTPINGVGPYTYSWSNGDTDGIADNIPLGTYQYTVTDANGCAVSGAVVVDYIGDVITFTTPPVVNIDCGDTIQLVFDSLLVNNGPTPITYSLYMNNQSTGCFTGNFDQSDLEIMVTVNGDSVFQNALGISAAAWFGGVNSHTIQFDAYPGDLIEVWIKDFDYTALTGGNCGVPIESDYVLQGPLGVILTLPAQFSTGNILDTTVIISHTALSNGYSYTWQPTTGMLDSTDLQPWVQPVSSQLYTLTVDGGCVPTPSTTMVIVNEDVDFSLAFTVNQQLFTAPPFAAQFTNATPNMASYDFTWDYGDGTVVQSNNGSLFHQYSFNGTYDVTLMAEHLLTGCRDTLFQDDYIFCTGGSVCTHTATISQTGPLTACENDSLFLTCNTDPSFSYQWQLNGASIGGATDTIYYPLQSGNYSVLILQNGCPITSTDISVVINSSPAAPTITALGQITFCAGGSVDLEATAGFASYLWSTGGTSQIETVTASGNYSVTGTAATGCSATSAPFSVNASGLTPPDICLVGVDTATNNNMIVWEKPFSAGIDSFRVYKEGSSANVYEYAGSVDYNVDGVFIDANSNPAVQANRYKLAIVDTCGTVTLQSPEHKTIHLTINQGSGLTWNLIWSHYEGFSFPSYNIFRGSDPQNMTLLTTIASNLDSYTDLTPPLGTVVYQIEVVSPNVCDPTRATYENSRSNIVNEFTEGLMGYNALEGATLYPNPNNGEFSVSGILPGTTLELTNAIGQVVWTSSSTAVQHNVKAKGLESGVYFLILNHERGAQTLRLIVN
jgi:hypothetical protein